MWGAIAGAALSTLGSLWGGNQAAKAEQRKKKYVEDELKDNENWYNRRYNEDYTQRADAQRALTLAEDAIKRRNRASAGQQAVNGGTEESTAATKAANAQTLADATSQIAAKGAEQKDKVEDQYRSRKHELTGQLEGIEEQRAQNTINAVNGVAQAAGNIVNAVDGTSGTQNVASNTAGGVQNAPASNTTFNPNAPKSIFDVAAYTGIDNDAVLKYGEQNKIGYRG